VVPGEIYHVWTRSSDDGIAFVDDRDRRDFLTRLTVVARRHVWIVLAWCAMTTHYHLLVELVEATLSEGMKELNGGFSRHVQTDEQLLTAMRYIDLNPCEAGIVDDPGDWPWSSYRALAGLDAPEPFHAVERALGFLHLPRAEAEAFYRGFVGDALQPSVSDTVTS